MHMNKRHILLLLTTTLISLSAWPQHRADRQKLSDPESFTFIVFGDPQGYTKYDINQPIYELCTAWIADNVEQLHIKGVLFTGDLVEQNENIVRNRKMLNQTSKQMWEWSSHCLERLDGRVPYIIAGGNHEYGYVRGDEPFTHYPEYYTFERNPLTADHLVAALPNRMGQVSLENAAWEFQTDHWGPLLVIGTEWAPRDEVLQWARKLCDSDKYRNHTVIFLTVFINLRCCDECVFIQLFQGLFWVFVISKFIETFNRFGKVALFNKILIHVIINLKKELYFSHLKPSYCPL